MLRKSYVTHIYQKHKNIHMLTDTLVNERPTDRQIDKLFNFDKCLNDDNPFNNLNVCLYLQLV